MANETAPASSKSCLNRSVVVGVFLCEGLFWLLLPQCSHGRFVAPVHVPPMDQRQQHPGLVEAAAKGDLRSVKSFLDAGVSPNAVELGKDFEGSSALDCAAGVGKSLDVVRMLVEHGADVNASDGWGAAPIHSAAVWGNADIVAYLIAHGANVNADDDGASPLGYAQHGLEEAKTPADRARFAEVVRRLRNAGAREWTFAWPY